MMDKTIFHLFHFSKNGSVIMMYEKASPIYKNNHMTRENDAADENYAKRIRYLMRSV